MRESTEIETPLDALPPVASKRYCVDFSQGVVNATALQALLKSGRVKAKRFGRKVAVDFPSFVSHLRSLPEVDYSNPAMPKPPGNHRRGRRKASAAAAA